MHKLSFLLAVLAAVAGCRQVDPPAPAPFDQQTAFMKLSNAPTVDADWIATHAKDDWIALSLDAWTAPQMAGVADSLRARNPKIHIGTYWPVFSIGSYMRRADRSTYAGRYWNAAAPYLARTTEGDTAAIFANAFVWDIRSAAAREGVLLVLADYVRATGCDWAMLDFMSVPLRDLKVFQDPRWQEMEHGDLDFDQDGVAHWNDLDETQAIRQAFADYVADLRRLLPKGFRLIPNGDLALQNFEFCHLVNGCYVEGFPRWFYGSGDSPNYENAMNWQFGPPALPNLCQRDRWFETPGIVMLEDKFDRRDLGFLAALYDGAVELKRPEGDAESTKPAVDLTALGIPIGDAVVVPGLASRPFARGDLAVQIRADSIFGIVNGGTRYRPVGKASR